MGSTPPPAFLIVRERGWKSLKKNIPLKTRKGSENKLSHFLQNEFFELVTYFDNKLLQATKEEALGNSTGFFSSLDLAFLLPTLETNQTSCVKKKKTSLCRTFSSSSLHTALLLHRLSAWLTGPCVFSPKLSESLAGMVDSQSCRCTRYGRNAAKKIACTARHSRSHLLGV